LKTLALIFLITSCQNQENLIEKHFSNKDVKLINELVNNFKQSICPSEYSDICLNNYLESIRDTFEVNRKIETKLNVIELEKILTEFVDTLSKNSLIIQCEKRNLEKNL